MTELTERAAAWRADSSRCGDIGQDRSVGSVIDLGRDHLGRCAFLCHALLYHVPSLGQGGAGGRVVASDHLEASARNVRVAHGERRCGGLGLGMGGGSELGFVLGEGGSLEVKAGDLPPELTDRPVSPDAFAGVEIPLVLVVLIHDQFQVAVG